MDAGAKLKSRIILSDPIDVALRLRDLGLTPECLREAVDMGQAARSSCTLNDPPSAQGIFGWGRTVRGLRESTQPLKWTRYADNHIHGIINESGTMVVTVATGDVATASLHATPKTQYPKGDNLQAAVRSNAEQLDLFSQFSGIPNIRPAPKPKRTCLLWLLMMYETETEVRSELALPDVVGKDERVEEWVERLVLAPIPIDSTPRLNSEPEMTTEIDVPLTRKGKAD